MAGLSKALLTSWRLIMGPGGPGGPAGPGRLSPSRPASPWKTSLRYSVSGNTKCSKLQKLQNVCACGISALVAPLVLDHLCSPLVPVDDTQSDIHLLVFPTVLSLIPSCGPFICLYIAYINLICFLFSCLSTNTGHGAFGSRLT